MNKFIHFAVGALCALFVVCSMGAKAALDQQGVNVASYGGTTVALGQATMATSQPVAIASNQSAVPSSQSGTWTVQPGNTPNTSAWKVDGSAVTQPISGTVLPGNTANTVPWLTSIAQGGNTATVTGSNALKVDASSQPISIGSSVAISVNPASATAFTVVPSNDVPLSATHEQAAGVINASTASTALWAAQAGKQHHLAFLSFINSSSTTGTEIQVLDGSTVIAEGYCGPAGGQGAVWNCSVTLVGTVNTALNIKTVTSTSSVFYTATGYYQ